jgi:hypothetical protein
MDKLISAIDSAAKDSVEAMEKDLRSEASAAGWDLKTVNAITVKYEDSKFHIHIPEEHADSAFTHEYGSETTSPTAVLRRYSHGSENAAKELISNAEKHFKGIL